MMSTTSESTQTGSYETEEQEIFNKNVEMVMKKLPEQFEEHSGTCSRDEHLILRPTESHSGASDLILTGSDLTKLHQHGFSLYFAAESEWGLGVEFWFSHEIHG